MIFKRRSQGRDDMNTTDTPSAQVTLSHASYEQALGLAEDGAAFQRAQILDMPGEQPAGEIDPESAALAFGLYRLAGGGLCVQFFQKNGDVTSIPYSHIVMIRTYKQSTLSLRTSFGMLILIEGQQLGYLRDQLSLRRVAFVKESFRGPGETGITSIEVQDAIMG